MNDEELSGFLERLEGVDVSVVVNNVGISYGGTFDEQPTW
jgi:hypothetical protein